MLADAAGHTVVYAASFIYMSLVPFFAGLPGQIQIPKRARELKTMKEILHG